VSAADGVPVSDSRSGRVGLPLCDAPASGSRGVMMVVRRVSMWIAIAEFPRRVPRGCW
jgi:hypothetical protein